VYNINNKQAKKRAKQVWKNKVCRETTINMLNSIDNNIYVPKTKLKEFKTLSRYKKGSVRIIVEQVKGSNVEKIVAIVDKKDWENLLKGLKTKYD
jgi:mRNA-degrading endonuclease RelE of RelBE toxin-antitoxin system